MVWLSGGGRESRPRHEVDDKVQVEEQETVREREDREDREEEETEIGTGGESGVIGPK